MTSITFDTLDAARTLRSAGVDEKTAEAIVAVVQRTTDLPSIEHLATKTDVEGVRLEVKATNGRIDDLRTILFASLAFNLTGFLGVAGFLYMVLKH